MVQLGHIEFKMLVGDKEDKRHKRNIHTSGAVPPPLSYENDLFIGACVARFGKSRYITTLSSYQGTAVLRGVGGVR